MAKFDKTFPTLDCAACVLSPKMAAVGNHPNITLWTYSDVVKVDGFVGNFKVMVRRKARYVLEDLCTGCLECIEACVYKEPKFRDEFNLGFGKRKPVYISFPQAVPPVPVIDPETCIDLKTGRCKKTCVEACGRPQGHRSETAGGSQGNHCGHGYRLHGGSRYSTPSVPPTTGMGSILTSITLSRWSAL